MNYTFIQSQSATLESERDSALEKMKAMANQCETVASELELLAQQFKSIKEELLAVNMHTSNMLYYSLIL